MNDKAKTTVLAIVATGLIAVGIFLVPRWLAAPASSPQGANAGFSTIASRDLFDALKNKDFYFINVHIPYEGEIRNTDAFIPYDKISKNLDRLPADKNAKIVLYCRSGRMSEIAAKELAKLGYANVSHLGGGMIDWEKNGYEIIKK